MTVAMIVVGTWVSSRIERGVVLTSASSSADYVDNFVAPLSDDFRGNQALSPPVVRALEEIFATPSVRERVVSYKIWRPGGVVLFASDPSIIGRTFEASPSQKRAWQGQVTAAFIDHAYSESTTESDLGVPLLEVYSPVREFFTSEVIAVVEFYQNATQLQKELSVVRRQSWVIVGASFVASGVLLFSIVQAGGQTIRRQKQQLEQQLKESKAMAAQNLELRRRVVSASSRATAQAEKTIRRVGSELHDGPAQYIALAALRLESAIPADAGENARDVQASLQHALAEIRTISRGLALPELDRLDVRELAERAAHDRQQQTGVSVSLEGDGERGNGLDFAQKLCVYRFIQEALSNVARHAQVHSARVRIACNGNSLVVAVHDDGSGFDPETALRIRTDGGQGLLGLMDRAESIGGGLTIHSEPSVGTTVTLTLPLEETVA